MEEDYEDVFSEGGEPDNYFPTLDERGLPIYYSATPYNVALDRNSFTTGQLFDIGKETFNVQGQVVSRQIRATAGSSKGGQFGSNIFSGGQYNQDLENKIRDAVREMLLKNYDRLVEKISEESTGALRRSIVEGSLDAGQQFEGMRFTFKLKNQVRTRTRQFSGWTQETQADTAVYGPIIFFGREAINSANKMIFAAYGNTTRPEGSLIMTNQVQGSAPRNIFEFGPDEKQVIADSISQPVMRALRSKVADILRG